MLSTIAVFQGFEDALSKYPQSIMPFVDTLGYTEEGDAIRVDDLFTLATETEAAAIEQLLVSLDA